MTLVRVPQQMSKDREIPKMKTVFKTLVPAIAISTMAAFSTTSADAADKKVAIANLGPHPVLKMVVDGFKAGMADSGFKE